MNVVDSSGWLEYFANGPNADFFAAVSIYEVFERVLQQRGEGDALQAVAVLAQGEVTDLDTTLALNAAKLSFDLTLPMADSIMVTTAQACDATLWTQDADFKDIPGVQYIERKP